MSLQFKHVRGSSALCASYAGEAGEIIVDTDENTVVVQNGTPGGVPLLKTIGSQTVSSLAFNNTSATVLDPILAIGDVSGSRLAFLPQHIQALHVVSGAVQGDALYLNNLGGGSVQLGNPTVRASHYAYGQAMYVAGPAYSMFVGMNTSLNIASASSYGGSFYYYSLDAAGSVLGNIEYYVASSNTALYRFNVRDTSTSTLRMVFATGLFNGASYCAYDANLIPNQNNVWSLGSAGNLWTQVYAANQTISTSDERLKCNFALIPDQVLDAWGSVDWVQFKYKEAVQRKGEAGARTHIGSVAQHILQVFAEHDLDATQYGLFCFDTIPAHKEERIVPVRVEDKGEMTVTDSYKETIDIPESTLYSLRYTEALCLEAAYLRRRCALTEARLLLLEDRLNKLEEK